MGKVMQDGRVSSLPDSSGCNVDYTKGKLSKTKRNGSNRS